MYHSHFGLLEEPFGATPDPRFFYRTSQHREAVATVVYAIQQRRGFALLVGKPGLGKTSVLFTAIRMLKGSAQIAHLVNPCYDRSNVLDSILTSFGLEPAPSPAANQRLFHDYLMKTRQEGGNCVVILDEAQHLDRDTLEAIRLLSNFETAEGKLVQIVLAGQPALGEILEQPDCEQIRQRINAISSLTALTHDEVREYMAHRLATAGGGIGLFSSSAINAIAAASGGVPRNINNICFNALTLAYAMERRQVGPDDVAEVCRDLKLAISTPEPVSPAPAADMETSDTSAKPVWPRRSLRPAWIAAALALLVAAAFVFAHI